MPDISEYITSGNGTLKASDFGDDAEVVISGYRSKKWEDQEYPTHYLQFAGYEKEFRLGIKNMKRVVQMYGTKTEGWIGKPLKLFKDETTNPKTGEPCDTMLVRVPRTKTANQAPTKRQSENPADDMDEAPF